MKVLWLAVASVVSAAGLATRFGREVWVGMFAPLVVVVATWILIERIYKANPDRLTAVMMASFAGKLVFFGAYAGFAIAVLGVKPVPFAISFAGYFIALNAIEAFWMKRLFDNAARSGT